MSTPSNNALFPTSSSPSGNSYSHHVPGTNIWVQFTTNTLRRLVRDAQGLEPSSNSSGVLLGTYAPNAGEAIIRIEDYDFVTPSDPVSSSASESSDLLQLLSVWKTTSTGRIYAVGLFRLGHYRNVSKADAEITRTEFRGHPAVMLAVNNDLPPEVAGLLFAWTGGTSNAKMVTSVLPLAPAVFTTPELKAISDRKPDAHPTLSRHALPSSVPALPGTVPGSLQNRGRTWLLVLSVVLMIVVATLAIRRLWPSIKLMAESSGSRAADRSTALLLQAVRSKGEIVISWNHTFPIAVSAAPASLTIIDGGYRRVIPLDATSFREGKVSYLPSTDDVDVRLEAAAAQDRTLAESVHLLGDGRIAALERFAKSANPQWLDKSIARPPESRPAQKARVAAAPPGNPAQADSQASLPAEDTDRKATFSSPPVSGLPAAMHPVQETPHDTDARGMTDPRPTPIAVLPRAHSPLINEVLSQKATTPNGPAEQVRNQKPEEQALPLSSQSPSKSLDISSPKPEEQPSQLSSQSLVVSPPQPIYQRSPRISSELRGSFTLIKKEVHIVVDIDETGKVTRTHVVDSQKNNSHLLENAASDAARVWRFRPAKIGDKSVPSTMVLVFKFSL